MTIQSQIQKTRELLAKATSGPWHVGHISELDDSAAIDNPELLCVGRINIRPDQNLVCHARNVLLLYVEVVEKCVETLESECVCYPHSVKCAPCKLLNKLSAILCRGEGE